MSKKLDRAVYYSLKHPDISEYSIQMSYNIHHTIIKRKTSAIKPLLDENFTLRVVRAELRKISNNNKRNKQITVEDEQKIVCIIDQRAQEGTGLNSLQIRELAGQLYSNSEDNYKIFSNKWYYSFMHKHPELSPRKGQNLTSARAQSLTTEIVDDLFLQLKQLYELHNLTADRIFNLDEKGFDGESSRPVTVVC